MRPPMHRKLETGLDFNKIEEHFIIVLGFKQIKYILLFTTENNLNSSLNLYLQWTLFTFPVFSEAEVVIFG